MPDVSVRITGLDELFRKLDASTADATLRRGMHKSVFMLQADMAKYPDPPAAGDWKGFVSDRQRRAFFAKLRSGEIEVPYRRQGTLGRRWTTKVSGFAQSIQGFVGNVTSYARYVQDEPKQAEIHKGRWPTVQGVVKADERDIIVTFADEIEAAMKRA